MTDTSSLRTLLQPELEDEFDKNRKIIEYLPDGPLDFKPHDRSMSFDRLAGHTADIAGLIHLILTTPDVTLGSTPMKLLKYETKPQLLAEFNQLADQCLTALKNTSDETFHQTWKLSYKGQDLYSGSRYGAYRNVGINHMIHHRGQLGVYIRLLDHKVPALFGPSADEAFG